MDLVAAPSPPVVASVKMARALPKDGEGPMKARHKERDAKPEKTSTLLDFYKKTQPGGPGWKKIFSENKENLVKKDWNVPSGILATILGCFTIYGALFGTGYWIYGKYLKASILTIIVIILSFILRRLWFKIKSDIF